MERTVEAEPEGAPPVGSGSGFTRVHVPSGVAGESEGYPVVVGEGVLDRLPELIAEHAPAARFVLISDDRVGPLHGVALCERLRSAGHEVDHVGFPAGEESKNRSTWAELTDRMLGLGVGRDAAVIALGGGVTGDLAGFVAATYMRGVPVVQVPTSLVAMVDAAVGGKTGIDVPGGKNLVGAFHPPRLVAVDPSVVRTLPRAERVRGMAEAVKHGAILDEGYFEDIEGSAAAILDGEPRAVLSVVLRSIVLKADVVGRDEREGGIRRILNFGHTVGHALESATAYALPHGEAVALGMIIESRLGERLGVTAEGTSERLRRVLTSLELPVALPFGVDVDAVLRFTRSDKKNVAGRSRYVLLSRIGEVDPGTGWVHAVLQEDVEDGLREFL